MFRTAMQSLFVILGQSSGLTGGTEGPTLNACVGLGLDYRVKPDNDGERDVGVGASLWHGNVAIKP